MGKSKKHTIHDHVCITCTMLRVQERLAEPVDTALVFKWLNEAMEELDPNRVRWAIEDEQERKEWERLIVAGAVKLYENRNGRWKRINPNPSPNSSTK